MEFGNRMCWHFYDKYSYFKNKTVLLLDRKRRTALAPPGHVKKRKKKHKKMQKNSCQKCKKNLQTIQKKNCFQICFQTCLLPALLLYMLPGLLPEGGNYPIVLRYSDVL